MSTVDPDTAAVPAPALPPAPVAAAPPVPIAPSVPSARDTGRTDIAVVGMSVRSAAGRDVDALWSTLLDGTPTTREAGGDEPGRRDVAGLAAAYLDGVDEFDPLFFEIAPADAVTMDPRQRLLMQETWHALEDAGIGPRQRRERRIATYVGAEDGYFPRLLDEPAVVTANHTGVLASRIAYLLDLDGPAVVLNTACSSGLVAVHQARQALLAGECDTALAAGVNVLVSGDHLQLAIDAGMTSPSGVCRPFDADADGIVPGEAVVVLVLRRLADALRDGDRVLGVVRATGINYDGRTNGLTAPSRRAQADLVRRVHTEAGVTATDIGCVLSHGTGTPIGDPIEVDALVDAVGEAPPGSCALVSAKGAVGHAFAASGVLNLAALLMALRTGVVPGTAGYRRASGYVEWDRVPFRVSPEPLPWPGHPAGTGRPRVGVTSAFGMTGTNAHVVVEEPSAAPHREILLGPYLLVLSGRDTAALDRVASELAAALARPGAPEFDSVCHTLLERRDHGRHRRALVVSDAGQAVVALRASGSTGSYDFSGVVPRTPPSDPGEVAGLLAQARAGARCPERSVLERLARAYVEGHDLTGDHLTGGRSLPVAPLPGYPFARKSYWPESRATTNAGVDAGSKAGSKGGAPAVVPAGSDGDQLVISVPREVAHLPRSAVDPGHRLIVLVRPGTSAVTAAVDGCEVFEPRWDRLSIPGLYADATVTLLARLKELLATHPDGDLTVQLVVPETGRAAVAAGLHGLVLSVCREQPRVWGQLVIVADDAPDDLTGPLAQVAGDRTTTRLTLRADRWWRTAWTPVAGVASAAARSRPGGVYLLTGAGGITGHLARHLVASAPGATVVLAGRSAPGTGHADLVRAVEADGGRCVHERADVTSRSDVHDLVDRVLREHGRLDGVVHAAGVLDDGYLTRKDPEAARAVLAPKMDGAVHLDEATRDLDLEFFVFCSSITSVLGNGGQTDYAAANGFLDGFAAERAGRVAAGTRRGTTVSIAWPLWADGGMRVDDATTAVLRETTGQSPLPAAVALRAFDQALALGRPGVAVLHGERARVVALLNDGIRDTRDVHNQHVQHKRDGNQDGPGYAVAPAPAAPAPVADPAGAGRETAVLARLAVLFAEVSGVAEAELDPDESLGAYGLDSFLVTRLNHRLAPDFPRAAKTLFFEHQTLREVAGALATTFGDDSRRWTVATPSTETTPATLATSSTSSTSDGSVGTPGAATALVRTSAHEAAGPAPIAIIGMSGRFPSADDLDEFWDRLRAGYDAVTEIPADRWPLDGFYEPDPERAEREHKSYCKWGGFLHGHADFDPLFFGISPREAVDVDPQERLFLQECWRAVEDAGYSRRRLAKTFGGRIGVYAGVTRAGYALWGDRVRRTGARAMPRTNFSSIPNRVSFVLDLSGPSMPIDTMCSSSLTAIHEACEHLRRGECDAALVGGVNIYSHPDAYVEMSRRRMLSPSGRCRSFGDGGDGMVPGEGVAVVMLKPLDAARRDGDRVLGVIAGSSVNHGGRTSGYTVPNPRAQAVLVSEALRRAGVGAREVSYVEAHGTGTALGDPVELSGLNEVFRADGASVGACALGSVKSNIGHLEAAAGIAGLAKIMLQLRHRELAPTLHADPPNPRLDLDGSPFRLQREVRRWTATGPLVAGLSSFGAGGTNAHVVIRADDDQPEPVSSVSSVRSVVA
ncbi:type I polyketide synthase [Amycolatopsis anabasis]|uniref:type I polyketide synthase n=1 Tax=Amycolatopsis anabasis TaxID=1840409 RepID=UPI00131C92D4|nr:type I polyketide synthase [Amycolatopsis anabasis]